MKIVLTQHALEQLERRRISVEWVEATVMQPQRRDPDPHDAALERLYRAIPQMGNRVLRVVVCWSSAEECRVVTAFPDRNAARDETEHKAR
jgi:hypothetical protein